MDNSNTKQKIIIQIGCLLLSIGLWFYVTNTENPLMVNDVNKIPVELINQDILKDSGLALIPDQEFYVSLKVEGLSQDLRRISREDFEVNIDLSEYALKKGENRYPVNIVDYPSKINIKNSSNLTVKINLEEYVVKDVEVESAINIIAKPNFYVAPPSFSPSTIKVSGPNSLVEKVHNVVAVGQVANISETLVNEYNLEARDSNGNIVEGIELSQNTVEGNIKVNEGKSVPVKIKTVGSLKEGLKLKLIDAEIKEVQITGPEESLNKINEISTEDIDLSTIKDNTTLDIALKVPEEVQVNVSVEKIKVHLVLEKVISKELSIGFSIVGVKEGLKAVTKNETIKIKVSGYEAEINNLKPENFKAELNVADHVEPGSFTGTPKVEVVGTTLSNPIEVLEKVSYDLVIEVNQ